MCSRDREELPGLLALSNPPHGVWYGGLYTKPLQWIYKFSFVKIYYAHVCGVEDGDVHTSTIAHRDHKRVLDLLELEL